MEVSQEWKILLFKDRFNYGGIKETSTGLVTCEFDLKNHLPEKVSNLFLTLIGEYILKTHQFTQDGRKKVLNNDLQDNSGVQLTNISSEKLMNKNDEDPYIGQYSAINSSDLHQKLHDIGNENEIIEGRKWIQKEFTAKLFEIIDEINSEKCFADHQMIEAEKNTEDFSTEELDEIKENKENWSFIPRLGSYLNFSKPALEFVKFICKVFSLEESMEETVNIMKKGCLKKMNLFEFDEESEYNEPSLELILPQMT